MLRFASSNNDLFSSESKLDFTLQDREHLFEIMAMRRRAAAGWNVHVDETVATGRVFAGHENCVRVSYQPNVRQVQVIGLRKREASCGIISRDRRRRLGGGTGHAELLVSIYSIERAMLIVCSWHFADMTIVLNDVRFGG